MKTTFSSSNEAKKAALKDIREALRAEGKTFIRVSMKALRSREDADLTQVYKSFKA